MSGQDYRWLPLDRALDLVRDAYRLSSWSTQGEPGDWMKPQQLRECFAEELGERFAALVAAEAIECGGCWPAAGGPHDAAVVVRRAMADIPAGWAP